LQALVEAIIHYGSVVVVLENQQIFRTPEVRAAGGLAVLQLAGNPHPLLVETKTRMFAA